jgi:hypothetical protein
MPCPICERRPPKRFCPAKGEKICALCCGREREVTLDCPSDCPYLASARRYEREHRKPLTREQVPYPTVEFSVNFVYAHWPVIGGIAGVIQIFRFHHRELNDSFTLAALAALAETYRTMSSGIYYERPPDAPLSRELYGELVKFLGQARAEEAERTNAPALKDSEVMNLLVFLMRLAKAESNGRPLTHGFIDFLGEKFPAPPQIPPTRPNAPRIIIP